MATKEKSEQDGQAKGQEVLAWRQKIEQEYTYCMISTLNQMVNYLPMLLFDFKLPKMYVTLKDSALNTTFDRNLKKNCQNIGGNDTGNRFAMPKEDIIIADVNDVSSIQATLSQKCKEKKVLWNITGGQRPFVMAVFELLKALERKDDLIIYMEGNSGKPTFLEVEGDKLKKVEPDTHGFERYKIGHDQWLTIPIALQLMGFNDGEKGAVDYTCWLNSEKDDETKPYLSLRDKVIKEENLRKKLLALNKKRKDLPPGFCAKEVLANLEEARQCFNELSEEELELLRNHKSQNYPFGHLLEKLFAQAIFEVVKGHIADMGVNIRMRYDDEKADEEAGKKQIDELDIAILTKTGQFAVFEVKSGDMESDVAKSTKYTTYSIAGVYGKPILLSPLLRSQLINLDTLNDEALYKQSASAARAARRAQLPIIALDGAGDEDFKAAIKKLLHL